jgi:hypothetical protein
VTAPTAERRQSSEIVIERCRPEYVASFLELYRTHLGTVGADLWNEAWFDWKYNSNPNVEGTSMVIARRGTDVVGAMGFFPSRMRHGDAEFRGILPVDVVIHPDHRSAKLFLDLVNYGYDTLADEDTILAFGAPREDTEAVWTRLARWSLVAQLPRNVRIHDISAVVADATGDDRLAMLSRVGQPVFWVSQWLTRHLRAQPSGTVDMTVHEGVPVEQLVALYERTRPEELHVVRDETFYQWRLRDAPHARYRTFVAERDGAVVAAIVTSQWHSLETVQVVDVLPAAPSPLDEPALRDLLLELVETHRDAGAIVSSPALPTTVTRGLGFEHGRYMARAGSLAYVPESIREKVPSMELIYVAKVLSEADEHQKADLLEWDEWAFTGVELDVA